MLSQPKPALAHTLFALALTLAACVASPPPPATKVVGGPAIEIGEVTIPPALTPSFGQSTVPPPIIPTATPALKTLVVCLPYEPLTLFAYGDGGSRDTVMARAAVLEALQDGPIDHRGYQYHPVILPQLPNLADNTAIVTAAVVREGEPIVDALGNITTLAAGIKYFDASGAQQTYDGTTGAVEAMQMSLNYTLMPGLLWEDGSPLTADDALFAFEVAKASDQLTTHRYLANRIVNASVVETYTLTWTYLPGFKDSLYFARFPTPLPRHLYGGLTASQLAADDRANRAPLSFGPYKVIEWVDGERIVLTPNRNYHRAAEGLPRFEQLIYRFIPQSNQLSKALIAGECHVGLGNIEGTTESIFVEHLDSLRQAEAQGKVQLLFANGSTFEHLDFNISPVEGYKGLASTSLFADVRVRQAFAYCIDRQGLVNSLLGGRAEVPTVYVSTGHPLYDARGVAVYPFNPQKGLALLKEAGWQDKNGDGVLEKGNQKLTPNYYYGPTGNQLRGDLAALLQAQLKTHCGIDIVPKELDRADLFGSFPDGLLFGRQYDLGQFAWVAGDEPPCDLYTIAEWSGLGDGEANAYGIAIGYPEGSNNVGFIDPLFDAACRQALSTFDLAQKRALHHEAMKRFAEQVPSVMLFNRPELVVASAGVFGFAPDPSHLSDLWNLEAMDLVR